MKESKNLGVVAAVVVFRVIILNYARFYHRTGINEEDLSPCWSSHREQSRRVIAHSLSSIGHEHEYGQRYYPGASHGCIIELCGEPRGATWKPWLKDCLYREVPTDIDEGN